MSDHKAPNVPDDFEEAERFKRLFIDPSVAAMGQKIEAELRPIVDGQHKLFALMEEQKARDNIQDGRLDKLEGSQAKALLGYGVFATGLSVALAASWDWIKGKFYRAPLILVVIMLMGCGHPEVQTLTLTDGRVGGSGFVLRDGVIVTAKHVVDGSGKLVARVETRKGATTMPTTNPVGRDGEDIATLEAPVKGHARTRAPRIGEEVTVLGFVFEPRSHRPIQVKSTGRVIAGPIILRGEPMYLIQGAAGPGMSGCPVIGADGAVIGVISGEGGSATLIRIAPFGD